MLAHHLLLKAARIILEWDQPTLAEKAGVSLSVITSLEKGRSISAQSWLKTQQALEAEGISFIPELESGVGAGLRVQKRLSFEFNDSTDTRNRPPELDSEDRS